MTFTDPHWAKVLRIISIDSYINSQKRDESLRDNWSNLEDESWCNSYLADAQVRRLTSDRNRLSQQIDEIDQAIADLGG